MKHHIKPMADKMKHDFYVPVIQQVALNNVPFRYGHSSQNFGRISHVLIF